MEKPTLEEQVVELQRRLREGGDDRDKLEQELARVTAEIPCHRAREAQERAECL